MGATTAWMLRRDGKSIEVSVHPYGDYESSDYMIGFSNWFYDNTAEPETKDKIINLIASFAIENGCDSIDEFFDFISEEESYGDTIINHEFLERVSQNVSDAINLLKMASISDSTEYNREVINRLNNEFCKVRAGGTVDSDGSLGDMYFRISTNGFNWFDVIWQFVYNNQHKIDTVTVVRDNDNFSKDFEVYRHNGKPIDKMPINDFISLSGRPVFEKMEQFV